MQQLRIQADIAAAPQALWDLLTDLPGWTHWSGVSEVVVRQKGEPTPNGFGAIYVLRSRGIAIEQEVVGFDAPHHLRYRIVSGIPVKQHEAEVVLTRGPKGTHLDWSVHFEPRFPGTGALIARLMRREIERFVARLGAYPFEPTTVPAR